MPLFPFQAYRIDFKAKPNMLLLLLSFVSMEQSGLHSQARMCNCMSALVICHQLH